MSGTWKRIQPFLAVLIFVVVVAVASFSWFGVPSWFSIPDISVAGWAAIAVIAYILIRNSIIVTPTVHVDVVLFFKKPTGRVMKNGIHFIWPFVCSVRRVSLELTHTPFDETFFSNDKLKVRVRGSIQWVADERYLPDVFITRSEAAITKGLLDAVHGELGKIAGLKKGDAYIEAREIIDLIINGVLRLDLKKQPLAELTVSERFQRCTAEPEKRNELRQALDEEEGKTDEVSPVERLYGIDIKMALLADVDYEEETQKAFQLGRQTKERVRAFRTKAVSTLLVARKLQSRLGVTGTAALNASQVVHEDADKQVQTVEGLEGGGALPLAHVIIGGQGGRKSPEENKGSEGGKKKIIEP